MSTLDDYTDTNTDQSRDTPDRTQGHDAPELVYDGHVASGDRLMRIQANNGVTYWYRERSGTTLELRDIHDPSGDSLPTEAAAHTVYEDLPAEVRKTLKLEGYRMVQRNGMLAGLMD